MTIRSLLLSAAALAGLCTAPATPQARLAAPASAMPVNPRTDGDDWWKYGVFYEIYPRSFADSDNDGLGDLNGITGRMGYLRDLGIDAIWVTPMFPSPQIDFGYDVSDFRGVDPRFGTLADMDRLIATAHRDRIKVVLDLVVNHSSDKHPWFSRSRADAKGPYRDYYIWRDGRTATTPPNNWTSQFGGSAWTRDPTTGQYYYHMYTAGQPDLNLRNPKVEQELFDVARWWFRRGVYGFRLDAVDSTFERTDLADNPELPGFDEYGMRRQDRVNNYRLPERHPFLQRLRGVANEFPGRVLVGETGDAAIAQYYGPKNNEVQLPMLLSLARSKTFTATLLREQIERVQGNAVGGWPALALDNHDLPRMASRWTPAGVDPENVSRLGGALLLTMRGTPILYYGQEIGMLNHDPSRVEDVQDPIGRRGWPQEKGRDGERTPMPWDASVNAGFNRGAKPWLPVGGDYRLRNVAAQAADPGSTLAWYRKLIVLRRTAPALAGSYRSLDRNNAAVFSYLRSAPGEDILVMLNISATSQRVPLAKVEVARVLQPLAINAAAPRGEMVELAPFGVFVARVQRR